MTEPIKKLTTEEAAEYIGWTESTLKQYRHKGKGPAYIKAGTIYYLEEDLDSWIRNNRVDPEAPKDEPKEDESGE